LFSRFWKKRASLIKNRTAANFKYRPFVKVKGENLIKKMQITEKNVNVLLYVTEGVGAIFVAIFLAAYLGGLPSTNVLHSEPVFRISLTIFGVVLLVLILVVFIMAIYLRKKGNIILFRTVRQKRSDGGRLSDTKPREYLCV
jgi:ABC-type branched-subunit amino acid transport system permease subunit